MPVEIGNGDSIQDTLDPDETVIARHEASVLIVDENRDEETVSLSEIDTVPARVRFYEENHEDTGPEMLYTDMTFDSLKMARLAFGLWVRCGPFHQPEEGTSMVPIEIASTGQDAIAAYLRVGNGHPRSRGWIAEQLDVTQQTVSNYCNRVRWKPTDTTEETDT